MPHYWQAAPALVWVVRAKGVLPLLVLNGATFGVDRVPSLSVSASATTFDMAGRSDRDDLARPALSATDSMRS